jgi:hypothetical protein
MQELSPLRGESAKQIAAIVWSPVDWGTRLRRHFLATPKDEPELPLVLDLMLGAFYFLSDQSWRK